jgi:HD-GYP domain-containing protein (c-di-GMP phosphodiesterase class II)
MRLGKKIYNEEGLVLLNERVELTQSILRRLKQYGITRLYIEDSRTEDIVPQDPISDETRRVAMNAIRTGFRQFMTENWNRGFHNTDSIGKTFREPLSMMIDDIGRNPNAMLMLTDISVTDLYLFQHSLNVGIYSIMLGLSLGFSREQLTVLGLGALLHDIGKTKLPLQILQKPGKLNDGEYELMKKHTEFGYRLLKDEPNIPLISAHCALQHHERLDGSGYPNKLRGDEIHEYAKWLGIVDSYDAMTSNRVYREAMLPHQALEVLFAGAGTLFDKDQVEHFRNRIAIYPIGSVVKLSTGETGVVVDVNSHSPQRPVVRILEDEHGQELKEPQEVDLSKHLSVMIVSIGGASAAAAK